MRTDRTTDRRTAVELLYRQEGHRLWRTLVLQTGDPDLASDACAEAFVQLLGRWEAVRDPRAWVWKAALRISDRERAARGSVREEIEESYELPEPVEDLVRALAQLSPMQRQAVSLRYMEDLSIAEIAELLGSSRGAVAVHLHRGRRRLRELLEVWDA